MDGERYGYRVDETTAEFRCTVCGSPAGTVCATKAGEPVELGPPLPARVMDSDGALVVGFFGHAWKQLTPAGVAELGKALAAERPDPVAIRSVDPEIAPFYCVQCEASYCLDHWDVDQVFDGSFYDRTQGTCPFGHPQLLDD